MVIPAIPAKAGIQEKWAILDPGVRRPVTPLATI